MSEQENMVTRCLVLALVAPTDKQAQGAADLAEDIAHGLSAKAVERCKSDALAQAFPVEA